MNTRATTGWCALLGLSGIVGCGEGAVDIEPSLPSMTTSRAAVVEIANGKLIVGTSTTALAIDDAKILVGEVEIEGDSERSEESFGPVVLEIGLAGQPTAIQLPAVRAGDYQELGLELTRGASIPDLAHEFADGESLVVTGAFEDQPFRWATGWAPEIEFDVSGLKVRDGEVARVSITFDVAAWFVDAAGNVLDPSDRGNADAIVANIESSLDAEIEHDDDDDD